MTYTPRMTPRAHQATAITRSSGKPEHPSKLDVFAYLMEYGTGKSKVLLDEYGQYEDAGEADDLLLVAPAGVYLNWSKESDDPQLQGEMQKHLDPALYARMAIAPWRSGSREAKQRCRWLCGLRDRPRALLVNVEALSLKGNESRTLIREFLEGGRKTQAGYGGVVIKKRGIIGVDESTVIRGDSERSDFLTDVSELALARRIMTGLVTPNRPTDLFRQFRFLDWRILGFRTMDGFKSRHAIQRRATFEIGRGGFKPMLTVGYRNEPELHDKINPYSYRVRKDECLDLPEKIYLPIREVEMTKEQARIYTELRDEAIAELEAEAFVTAPMVMVRRMRLQTVLLGFVKDSEKVLHEIPSNREAALVETLEDHDGKAIVWTPYRESVERVVRALEKAFGPGCTAQWHGGNTKTRENEEIRFLKDEHCRFMVATPQSGGRGRTWIVASLACYMANSEDLEHRLNSEDRCHRDGLTHNVAYLDYAVTGTIETKKILALRKKIDMATIISGDSYREWLI